MPLAGKVRYRWTTPKSGKRVRLAFRGNKVVEAKSETGETHTEAEFKADRKGPKKLPR